MLYPKPMDTLAHQLEKPAPAKLSGARILDGPGTSGFPSPADDYLEPPLNLHDHLVRHPAATFFVRYSGTTNLTLGLESGDLLLIDRSEELVAGDLVLVPMGTQLQVARIDDVDGVTQIWGVVLHIIRSTRR